MEVKDRSSKQSNNLPSRSNFHVPKRSNANLNPSSKMFEPKYQSSKYLDTYNNSNQPFNVNGRRRIYSNTFEFLQKRENLKPIKTITSSYIRRDSKISEGNPTKTKPKTPDPLTQTKNMATQNRRNSRNIIQTSIDNTNNSAKINKNNYLNNGAYYRSKTNIEKKMENPIVKNKENKIIYQKTMEDKENLDQNVKKILKKYGYDDDKAKIIKPVYYFNERGGVVFKSIKPPTTSIVIMNTKPDYSRYQKNSKILGKNKNIKIYEAPAPKTKVTIRTLNGKRK